MKIGRGHDGTRFATVPMRTCSVHPYIVERETIYGASYTLHAVHFIIFIPIVGRTSTGAEC